MSNNRLSTSIGNREHVRFIVERLKARLSVLADLSSCQNLLQIVAAKSLRCLDKNEVMQTYSTKFKFDSSAHKMLTDVQVR